VSVFTSHFPSVVLARLFLVVRFDGLPEFDRSYARKLVAEDPRLGPGTPVLSLLGSAGHEQRYTGRATRRLI
jgi:hypothetical protein